MKSLKFISSARYYGSNNYTKEDRIQSSSVLIGYFVTSIILYISILLSPFLTDGSLFRISWAIVSSSTSIIPMQYTPFTLNKDPKKIYIPFYTSSFQKKTVPASFSSIPPSLLLQNRAAEELALKNIVF